MLTTLESEVPEEYALEQNYPNPFNPATTIGFSLPEAQRTRIYVTDMLGRRVATLLDDQVSPGRYEVVWNAQGVASGVYFYRIVAGSFQETKRMVLLK